ncbi:MAG TPA: ethanolamine ammonia-lyase subunit EutC [Polyangia bacterium]
MIDRSQIEAMVRAALAGEGAAPAADATAPILDGGGAALIAPDRGVNLGTPADPAVMRRLLARTPARIAVGRAGTRYRTNTLLRLRADHACARDAVMSEVPKELLAQLGLFEVRSRAADKQEFLVRPDLGRHLCDEGRAEVARRVGPAPQLLVIYGDGLSAAAITAHLATFHEAFTRAAAAQALRLAPPFFVRHSRVKVMDEIARLVDAEAAVFTCGERPGLGYADSLSAYFIYRPAAGATDANREVVSNINPRGLAVGEAARVVAESCARILRDKRSGVVVG